MRLHHDVIGCKFISPPLTRVPSRITEPFTAVPDRVDELDLSGTIANTYRRWRRLLRLLGGECDWARRRIAAHFKMGVRTLIEHLRVLESKGLIHIRRRRRLGHRVSDTNIYTLPGGRAEIRTQKHTEKHLNTNAPAPASRRVDIQRVKALKDSNHPPEMPKIYNRIASFFEENKSLRALVRGSMRRSGGSNLSAGGRTQEAINHFKPSTTEDIEKHNRVMAASLAMLEAMKKANLRVVR